MNKEPNESNKDLAPKAADPQEIPGVVETFLSEVLGEAGGVSWVDMFTPGGAKINITCRASNPIKALDDLMAAMKHAKSQYGLVTCENKEYRAPSKAANTPAPQTPANNPAPAPKAPAPAPQQQPAPKDPAPSVGGSIIANRMVFLPRPDGLCKIEFYGANHKWPDLSMTSKPEYAVNTLSEVGAFTVEDFTKAAEYTVNVEVFWLPSTKTSEKGNPYKDVTTVKNLSK